jgi:hypothetical protein
MSVKETETSRNQTVNDSDTMTCSSRQCYDSSMSLDWKDVCCLLDLSKFIMSGKTNDNNFNITFHDL